MKKILIILLTLAINSTYAQDSITGTTFSIEKVSDNEYKFNFSTFFNLGSPGTCPPFVNHSINIIDDTLVVKGYYQTTGIWPAFFCSQFDTVTYNDVIPANVNFIKMSTNEIGYNNTPPYIPEVVTYEDVFYQFFSVASLSNDSFKDLKNMVVYPNPSNGKITISGVKGNHQVKITDVLGHVVYNETVTEIANKQIDISGESGIYFISIQNELGDTTTKKIVLEK